MKIIISHDVDHIYASDHWFRDLIFPKLWVRSFLQMLKRQISYKEFLLRFIQTFRKEINNIVAVADFDLQHYVKSTFFFGMDNCLGMNYTKEKSLSFIKYLKEHNIDCGVHGCNYQDQTAISNEYADFQSLASQDDFGIRMHYVRFNDYTFSILSSAGYLFDTSEFNKENGYLIKKPYRIGDMWEFPLTIMDGYLPYNFDDAKIKTLKILEEAKNSNAQYVSVLFHDYLYCEAYKCRQQWYEWLINYIDNSEEYEFISYKSAIQELEKE